MNALRGVFFLLAGLVLSLAMSQAVLAADASDKKLTVIQTYSPCVRQPIGEVLPAYGQVRLLVSVDADGKFIDCMLLGYTNQRYADAAVEAVKKWEFKPAVYRGKPHASRTTLDFSFETNGQVVSMSCTDLLDAYRRDIIAERPVKCVVPYKELDAVPKPIVTVSPVPVGSAEALGSSGVRVDFYIDETGRPRMASVDVRENDQMAVAALDAIEQWRFTPPTKDGKPVAIRASQRFIFSRALASGE
jgi:TonB family protein